MHDPGEPAWAPRFIEALARSGCVRQAVREAPVNRGSVYHHRRTNEALAQAWLDALATAQVGEPEVCAPRKEPEVIGPPVANWPRRFLQALAETSNVTASAERANVPVRKVYTLKRDNAEFAASWLAALHEGYDQLEIELLGYFRDPRPTRRLDVTGAIRVLSAHRETVERRRHHLGRRRAGDGRGARRLLRRAAPAAARQRGILRETSDADGAE